MSDWPMGYRERQELDRYLSKSDEAWREDGEDEPEGEMERVRMSPEVEARRCRATAAFLRHLAEMERKYGVGDGGGADMQAARCEDQAVRAERGDGLYR